jgi:hypothetical protein
VGGLLLALTLTGLPAVGQESPPTFSCCEHDIKVAKVDPVPQRNVFEGPGRRVTVAPIFLPHIHWGCNLDPTRKCLAFYDVTVRNSRWQELRQNGTWGNIHPSFVQESITTESPLKHDCDGRNDHKGIWMFVYRATVSPFEDELRADVTIDLDFPAGMEEKGTSYTLEVEITGVFTDQRRRDRLPTVKVKKQKEKEKKKPR